MLLKKSLLSFMVTLFVMMGLVGSNVSAEMSNTRATTPELSKEIIISDLDIEEYLPSVAYNWKHHEYLVVWHTKWAIGTRDIRGARISESGKIIKKFVIYEHTTKDSVQPDVAYDSVNDRYLVVFSFDTNGNESDWDMYGRFIPWDGPSSSLKEFLICNWGTHQWNPKIAYGRAEEEYLVVWNNVYPSGTPKPYISGRRIKASNGSFPGSESDLNISDTSEQRIRVDVTYNLARNEYLIVYDNEADILATRFTGRINHDFGGEFTIAGWSATESHPAVAACKDANQYLVTWTSNQSDQGPTPNDAIYGRFIGGDGTKGSVKVISDTSINRRESDVTCNDAGTQYLVAWQTVYVNFFWGIWGRLVNPKGPLDGTLEPSFGIVTPYSNKDRTNVTLAGGHMTYLAAWEHDRDSYQNIHGRTIFTGQRYFLPLILR